MVVLNGKELEWSLIKAGVLRVQFLVHYLFDIYQDLSDALVSKAILFAVSESLQVLSDRINTSQ